MTEKVVFPYDTLEEAVKDKFKKIGGPTQAFRYLVKGFKTIEWRKRADATSKVVEKEQDAAFEKENKTTVKKAPKKPRKEPKRGKRASA